MAGDSRVTETVRGNVVRTERATRSQASRRASTRSQLLAAAVHAFAVKGYAGTTVDAIAMAAGLSKGAAYFHFNSKEDIFLEVLWERARREQGHLVQTAGEAGDRPREWLAHIGEYLGPTPGDATWPPLILEFWAHASRNSRVREAIADLVRFRRSALFGALAAAASAGIIRPVMQLDRCTDLLLALGDHLLVRAGTGQGAPPSDLAGLVSELLGFGHQRAGDVPASRMNRTFARVATSSRS